MHRVYTTLRGALNAAVRQRRILHSPCDGVELEPDNPAEAKRWSAAEAARFIDCASDDPMGLMFRVMVLSGARRSELVGFRWAFADLEAAYRDPGTGEQAVGAVLTVKRTILQLGAGSGGWPRRLAFPRSSCTRAVVTPATA